MMKPFKEIIERVIEQLMTDEGFSEEEIIKAKKNMVIKEVPQGSLKKMPKSHQGKFTFPAQEASLKIEKPSIEIYNKLWSIINEKNYCDGNCSPDEDCYTIRVVYTAILMALISHLSLDEMSDENVKSVIGKIANDIYKIRRHSLGKDSTTTKLH